MTKSVRYTSLCGLLICLAAIQVFAGEPSKRENGDLQVDSANLGVISEAFGHMIGRNLNTPGIDFDTERVVQGILNAKEGKPSPMSDKDYEEFMVLIQERAFEKIAQENLHAAEAVLSKNKKEHSVVEIDPGKLQYRILKEGSGPEVTPNSCPVLTYTGRYADGTVFGSSEDAGGPIAIPLEQTIPGFSKGVLGMQEGEKREIIIHPELGYGTSGHLPPNSLLVFDVELVTADQKSQPLAVATEVEASTEPTRDVTLDISETNLVADLETTALPIETAIKEAATEEAVAEEAVAEEAVAEEAATEELPVEELAVEETVTTEPLAAEADTGAPAEASSIKVPSLERTALVETATGGTGAAEPSQTSVAEETDKLEAPGEPTAEPESEAKELEAPLPSFATR